MLNPITAIQNYRSTLSNSLDDISDFNTDDFMVGDFVSLTPYYESDRGGVGIIKKVTACDFKNPKYDASNPKSELFISLPCAIVVSTMPDENWLDYVPLTNLDLTDLDSIAKEYINAFPESTTEELFMLRCYLARRVSQFRYGGNADYGYVSIVPAHTSIVPIQAFQGGAS